MPSDNTVLNAGSGGDTIRDVAKTANSPAKTPVVILDIGGNADASSEVALAYTTKSVQGAYPIPTQDTKDGGRGYVCLTANRVTAVATATLLTCTQNITGSTSSATAYTVPTGTTLRIQALSATVEASSTAAARGLIGLVAASTASATSPLLALLDVPAITDTTTAGDGCNVTLSIPDGLEVAAGQQIALWQSCSTTSATVTVSLIGFYY